MIHQYFILKRVQTDFSPSDAPEYEIRVIEKDHRGYSGLSGQWKDTPDKQGLIDAVTFMMQSLELRDTISSEQWIEAINEFVTKVAAPTHYLATNETNDTQHTIEATNLDDAKQWVVNHCDLSLKWTVEPMADTQLSTNETTS